MKYLDEKEFSEKNARRLRDLGVKINLKDATKEEVDEYVELMYTHGHMQISEYEKYQRNEENRAVKGTIISAGIILASIFLLPKLFKENK